jgi:hypothetical protein
MAGEKDGAAPRPLAGARTHPLRSAPPSSGFVHGASLDDLLRRAARWRGIPNRSLCLSRSPVTRWWCGEDRGKGKCMDPPGPSSLRLGLGIPFPVLTCPDLGARVRVRKKENP